jgi:predicted acyl esterase
MVAPAAGHDDYISDSAKPVPFVPNIFEAKPRDYMKATQSVYYGAATPSAIMLPVAL